MKKIIKLSREAVPTGFEPAISALTGPHVRPLHHGTIISTYGVLTSGREFTIRNNECQYAQSYKCRIGRC